MRTQAPVHGDLEAATKEILRHPAARAAFERLCKKGCNREQLACRLLWVREDKASRNKKVKINLRECRRIGKALKRLAAEFSDLPALRYRAAGNAGETHKTVSFTMQLGWKPPQPVRFDPVTLRDQLLAGAEHLLRLAGEPKPRICYSEINDVNLQRLLDYVRESTQRAHYKEITTLCAAVAGRRHGADALKQRAHRITSK